jgi:hypothetical protein
MTECNLAILASTAISTPFGVGAGLAICSTGRSAARACVAIAFGLCCGLFAAVEISVKAPQMLHWLRGV